MGVLTKADNTIIYRARIMPQSYCIDPPRISESTKLPEDIKFITLPLFCVESSILDAATGSLIIGGTLF